MTFNDKDRPLRIALISPKGPLYRHRGGIFKKSLRYAPLTLTTLAALIPSCIQHQLEIYDEGIEDIPENLEADLIGMTVITGTANRSYELAEKFRKQGITVVLGGPHVTLVPDEAQAHADAVVTGYAEQSWPQLIEDFCSGDLKPRYSQPPDFTLNSPVFPKRELLDRRQYLTMNVFEATRSCNHNCDFCVAPAAWGRRPFQKPVKHVVEDIRRQGAKRLIFIDLNLIADRNYAAQLFEALIPLNVNWFGLSTTLISHEPELLDLMQRSGCTGLLLGFESISRANLKSARKGFNDPAGYRALIDKLHGKGISIMGCFVFGLDEDSSTVFKETAKFVVEACIDLPRFAISTPFPGTPLYARLEKEGRILTRNWELYDGQHVVFQPANMSVEDLKIGHEAAWRHAYSYTSMFRRIAGSRIQIPISIIANMGYRYYAHNLHRFYTCDWIIGARPDRTLGAA